MAKTYIICRITQSQSHVHTLQSSHQAWVEVIAALPLLKRIPGLRLRQAQHVAHIQEGTITAVDRTTIQQLGKKEAWCTYPYVQPAVSFSTPTQAT